MADQLFPSPVGPRVLIYHQVGVGHGKQMEVTSEDFEWQLDWLAEHRKVVDLETALSQWHSPDADQIVALTFDDGYSDTYTTAFPLLKIHGLPFTIFIATSYIGTDSERSLTWSQLEDMSATGLVTLGAHTHTHADVRRLEEAELVEELEISDSMIESRLGVRPRHFAYPWGYWAEHADAVIRDRYSSAVLGAPPSRISEAFDPFLIHRFPVQLSDGTRWFESRLKTGLMMEEELRRRLRGYRGP